MSFAHKPTRAKPRTASPKIVRKVVYRPIDRVDLLANAVVNLSRETESLRVLTTLTPRVPEYTSADAEAAAVHSRLSSLEATVTSRFKSIGEVEVSAPVTEDGVGVNFKDVQAAVSKAEEDSQIAGLEEKLALKAAEIAAKQGYIQHVQACAGIVEKARGETEFAMTDFQVSVPGEAANAKAHVEAMQKREAEIRRELDAAIVETQLLEKPSKKTKNKLVEELGKTVEKTMKELKAEFDVRFRFLELGVKQESLLLRLEHDSNKTLNLPRSPAVLPTQGEDASAHYTEALTAAEAQIESSAEGLREVQGALETLVGEMEGKLESLLAAVAQAAESEKGALRTEATGDFQILFSLIADTVSSLRRTIRIRESILGNELLSLHLWTNGAAADAGPQARLTTRLFATSQTLNSEVTPIVAHATAVFEKAAGDGGLKLQRVLPLLPQEKTPQKGGK